MANRNVWMFSCLVLALSSCSKAGIPTSPPKAAPVASSAVSALLAPWAYPPAAPGAFPQVPVLKVVRANLDSASLTIRARIAVPPGGVIGEWVTEWDLQAFICSQGDDARPEAVVIAVNLEGDGGPGMAVRDWNGGYFDTGQVMGRARILAMAGSDLTLIIPRSAIGGSDAHNVKVNLYIFQIVDGGGDGFYLYRLNAIERPRL